MFQIAEHRSFVQLDAASVATLYRSVNHASVQLPGKPPAVASAVVVGYRKPGGGYSVVVALHLLESGCHLVFEPDTEPLGSEGAREAAVEAIAFAESMGFFMESVGWRELDAASRPALLADLKVFQPPPASQASEERAPVDPRIKLARLLVQF